MTIIGLDHLIGPVVLIIACGMWAPVEAQEATPPDRGDALVATMMEAMRELIAAVR